MHLPTWKSWKGGSRQLCRPSGLRIGWAVEMWPTHAFEHQIVVTVIEDDETDHDTSASAHTAYFPEGEKQTDREARRLT